MVVNTSSVAGYVNVSYLGLSFFIFSKISTQHPNAPSTFSARRYDWK